MADDLFLAFVRGDASPETVAEIAERMLRWVKQTADDPLPLNRMLGLGRPRAARIALRDSLVIEASMLLEGSRWSRCKQLAELARTFHAGRYDVWRRVGIPAGASDVDRLLFDACDLGEPLPRTPEGYLSILPPPA